MSYVISCTENTLNGKMQINKWSNTPEGRITFVLISAQEGEKVDFIVVVG